MKRCLGNRGCGVPFYLPLSPDYFCFQFNTTAMKTTVKNKTRFILPLFILVFFCNGFLFPQQIIKFKSGKVYEVRLISQRADSIKYEMSSSPGIIFTTSMDEVEKIWTQPKNSGPGQKTKNPLDVNYLNEKIRKANNMTTAGVVLTILGGGACAVGFSIKTDFDDEDYTTFQEANQKALQAAVIALGVLASAGGITLTIIGATNSVKYKEKLKGLSVDVKATSSMAGISVRYRF
jgi:hypothetical protein